MPREVVPHNQVFSSCCPPLAWVIGASLRGSRTRQAGLCLPAGGMARLAHVVNDVLAESGAFDLGGAIRELLSRWFLLGETVQRTKAPDQAGRVEADNRPVGEAFPQDAQRSLVVGVAVGRHHDMRVADVKVRVIGREPLAVPLDSPRHRQLDDIERLAKLLAVFA